MTPAQLDILRGERRRIAEWEESIEALESGTITLRANGQDASAEHVAMLRNLIARNLEWLERYDPDGLSLE